MKQFVLALVLIAGSAAAGAPYGDLLAGVAPGPDGKIDVMTFTAHPDDESIYPGGTLIKMKEDPRVRLHVVCMTLGDKSDARFFMRKNDEQMARIRTKELHNAATALGADEVIQLDFHDQGLEDADEGELVAKVKELIAHTGAEIVITHDPSGLTHHPDHVTCSRVVTEACGQTPGVRLYYSTTTAAKYGLFALGSPFHEGGKRAEPTVRIDISAELPQKRKAVKAHESQVKHSLVGLQLPRIYWEKTEYFAAAQ